LSGTLVSFPNVQATSRSYSPGIYPQTEFKALNGSTTVLRYGNKRSDAQLTVGFANITDEEAALILDNYEQVNSVWNYVTFTTNDAADGASDSLATYIEEKGGSGLKWRYASPPSVTGVVPGRSTVQCQFQAFLDP
jgi:hypothetical protein